MTPRGSISTIQSTPNSAHTKQLRRSQTNQDQRDNDSSSITVDTSKVTVNDEGDYSPLESTVERSSINHRPTVSDTLALTAITDTIFDPSTPSIDITDTANLADDFADKLPLGGNSSSSTSSLTQSHRPSSGYINPSMRSLHSSASFDPFPQIGIGAASNLASKRSSMAAAAGGGGQFHQQQQHAQSQPPSHMSSQILNGATLDCSANIGIESETPSDILHYYQSYAESRRQIILQSLALVRGTLKCWSLLTSLSKDAAAKARIVKPKDVITGARQSTLAASYMSMVAAQQEQLQQAATHTHQPTTAPMEPPIEEMQESMEAEEKDNANDLNDRSVALAPLTTPSRTLGVSDMEKAVQTAHQAKLAREAEDVERARLELEELRYQQHIYQKQQALESDLATHGGESEYIRLQEESKSVPNVPLRVGLIGCGQLGLAIAEDLLQQLCGLPPPRRDGTKSAPPPVPSSPSAIRLFISTRRPDSPELIKLVKRCGGSVGAQGTHGTGGLITVYYDNARLLTECNVILLCVLPHQIQSIAANLRSLSPHCRTRSQIFFSITSSHTLKSLTHLLGSGVDSPQSICLARTSLILPHLIRKDSTVARGHYQSFTSNVIDALTRSMLQHTSFRSALTGDGVRKVVNGVRRQIESEVESCFVTNSSTSQASTPTAPPHRSSIAPSTHTSLHSVTRASLSSTSSTLLSPSPLASNSVSPLARSTSAAIGLTPVVYTQTPGFTFPRLKDIQATAPPTSNPAVTSSPSPPPPTSNLTSTRLFDSPLATPAVNLTKSSSNSSLPSTQPILAPFQVKSRERFKRTTPTRTTPTKRNE